MASFTRCRVAFPSIRKSTSLFMKKTKSLVSKTGFCATNPALPASAARIIRACTGAASPNSTTNLFQAITRGHSFQMSRNFQKFLPILACNTLSIAVAENLTDSGELEEGTEAEEEATSGRKRIRSLILQDDDP